MYSLVHQLVDPISVDKLRVIEDFSTMIENWAYDLETSDIRNFGYCDRLKSEDIDVKKYDRYN